MLEYRDRGRVGQWEKTGAERITVSRPGNCEIAQFPGLRIAFADGITPEQLGRALYTR